MYISQDIRIISLELLPCFKTNCMLVKSELYMYDPLMLFIMISIQMEWYREYRTIIHNQYLL